MIENTMLFLRGAGIIGLTVATLAACGGPLSTSSSIRVEVEVYKGPLSEEFDVQWGQFLGTLRESLSSLRHFQSGLMFASAGSSWASSCPIPPSRANKSASGLPVLSTTETINQLNIHFAEYMNESGEARRATLLVAIGDKLIQFQEAAAIDAFKAGLEYSQQAGVNVLDTRLAWLKIAAGRFPHPDPLAGPISSAINSLKGARDRIGGPRSPAQSTSYSNMLGCLLVHGIDSDLKEMTSAYNQLVETPPETIISADFGSPQCSGSTQLLPNCEKVRQHIRDVMAFAIRLKIKALYWSYYHLSQAPTPRDARNVSAGFSNVAANLSNQLMSRGDALLKQLHGRPRKLLPTSAFLKDSSPSDFVNIYQWNSAAERQLGVELLGSINPFSDEYIADRARTLERLYADHYWTNVNTVYGSGQGEVRMALIKDDIGNWNLKSFDSDPTELLDAYTDLTLAAIKAAQVAAGSPSAASGALELAGRLTTGRISPAPQVEASIKPIRDLTIGHLNRLNSNPPDDPEVFKAQLIGILEDYAGIIRGMQSAAAADIE